MSNDPSAARDPTKLALFREEQTLVAKLVHVLEHEDTDVTYQMLNVARKYLQPGGQERVSVTMPALVFASLKLLRRVQQLEFPGRKEVNGTKSEHNGEAAVEETKADAVDGLIDLKEDLSSDKAAQESEATKGDDAISGNDETARADQEDVMIGDVVVEENGDAPHKNSSDNTEMGPATPVDDESAPLFEAFTKTVR
jgi:hypothetical protein